MAKSEKFGDWAVGISASLISVTFFVGMATGQIYKHYNPNNVDAVNGLAYLREIMLFSVLAGAVVLLTALAAIITAWRRGEYRAASLALGLLILQLSMLLALVLLKFLLPTS